MKSCTDEREISVCFNGCKLKEARIILQTQSSLKNSLLNEFLITKSDKNI